MSERRQGGARNKEKKINMLSSLAGRTTPMEQNTKEDPRGGRGLDQLGPGLPTAVQQADLLLTSSRQVQVMSTLPLKAMSRLWGRFNELEIPYYLRVPGFKLYSFIFGVKYDCLPCTPNRPSINRLPVFRRCQNLIFMYTQILRHFSTEL